MRSVYLHLLQVENIHYIIFTQKRCFTKTPTRWWSAHPIRYNLRCAKINKHMLQPTTICHALVSLIVNKTRRVPYMAKFVLSDMYGQTRSAARKDSVCQPKQKLWWIISAYCVLRYNKTPANWKQTKRLHFITTTIMQVRIVSNNTDAESVTSAVSASLVLFVYRWYYVHSAETDKWKNVFPTGGGEANMIPTQNIEHNLLQRICYWYTLRIS